MKIIIYFILPLTFFCACQQKNKKHIAEKPATIQSSLIEIALDNNTSTVDLSSCKLVTGISGSQMADAVEILALKRKWPLAMQSKKQADFDSILGRNFTFKSYDFFYNREDYIDSRTKPDEWIISFVKYENVTLQFAGDIGILTYKNRVTNKSLKTGEIEYERIAWMDMYQKENGRWKIAAAHSIDYTLESPTK